MSDKEVKNQKVETKYDRKMQRRKEEKAKEEKQKRITSAIAIVAVLALVAFIASFPIRSYIAQHEAYVTINGEDVTKVEFDYYYNNIVNDYVNQYGAYLSYFGLDVTQDFSAQMYDDNLTWKDFFEEMTVDNLKSNKAIKAEADAVGFQYDASEEMEIFEEALKEGAKTAELSTKNYVKQLYGQYATPGNLTGFVAEAARNSAYYQQISDGMEATEEEITSYYEENVMDFDSVDYYVMEFPADIAEESPTEEQIEAAMNAACDEADAAVDTLSSDTEMVQGETYAEVPYGIAEWLFSEERSNGDTNVIEDLDNQMYYAVEFVNRYLAETPTANIRMISLGEADGQAVLDEWAAGAATEESFAELCKKNTTDSNAMATGGLQEGISADSLNEELAEWVFADERVAGDATAITIQSGYSYVLYYIGQGDAQWKVEIRNLLVSEKMSEYLDALVENIAVEDKNGRLNFLKVQAELEASADEDVSEGDVSDSDVSAN